MKRKLTSRQAGNPNGSLCIYTESQDDFNGPFQVRAPAPGTSESPNWEAIRFKIQVGKMVSSKMGRVRANYHHGKMNSSRVFSDREAFFGLDFFHVCEGFFLFTFTIHCFSCV